MKEKKSFNIKPIDWKAHKLLLGCIGGLILFLLVGSLIGLIFRSKLNGAAAEYDALKKATESVLQNERVERTIRYTQEHNEGAVDLLQAVTDTNDGTSAPFTLACVPGDAVTSPEYHNRRVASDTAYMLDWITPVFSYAGLNDYFTNYDLMQERFSAACSTSVEMASCKTQFFMYVMPDCSDLRTTVQDPNEIARYNASFELGDTYLINADFSIPPYSYTYLTEINLHTQNPNNMSSGNPNGYGDANFCVVYTIERDIDGNPIMHSIRFSSLGDIPLQ